MCTANSAVLLDPLLRFKHTQQFEDAKNLLCELTNSNFVVTKRESTVLQPISTQLADAINETANPLRQEDCESPDTPFLESMSGGIDRKRAFDKIIS